MTIIALVTILILGLPSSTYSFSNDLPVRAESVEEGHHDLQPEGDSEDSMAHGGTVAPSVVDEMIREAFPEEPDVAVAVAMCESSLDPSKIGDTDMEHHSYGLFQINRTWHKHPVETLLTASENIRIARDIYDRSGGNFNRWTCGRDNLYQKYL